MGVADTVDKVLGNDSGDALERSILGLSFINGAMGIIDQLAGGNSVSNAISDVVEMLTRPRIGVIDIKCDQYKVTGENEVPESLVIVQKTGSSDNPKSYITDSVSPHPRSFYLHGYIESLIPVLENGLLVKPTLLMQKKYLEALRVSRSWFNFRTKDAEIIRAIIQHLSIIDDPKFQNAFEIDVTLREFNLLEVEEGSALAVGESLSTKVLLSAMSPFSSPFFTTAVVAIAAQVWFNTGKAVVDAARAWTNNFTELPLPSLAFILPVSTISNEPVFAAVEAESRGITTGNGAINEIKDTSIRRDVESIYLNRKDTITLPFDRESKTASIVSPQNASNKYLDWNSSNINVATVNKDGLVTTKSVEGAAVISARSVSNPDIVASFTVRVTQNALNGDTKKAIHVERISVQPATGLKLRSGGLQGMKVVCFPLNATNRNIISISSDRNVAYVDDNMNIRAVMNGTCTITFTSEDTPSATVTLDVEVAYDGTNGNGGNPVMEEGDFSLLPAEKRNPLNGLPVEEITMPVIIPSTIDGSTGYMVPLTGIGEGMPYQKFTGQCGSRSFEFNFSWNWDAEEQYNDKIELLRNITNGMRVYKGLASYPVSPTMGPIRCSVDSLGNLKFYVDTLVVPNFNAVAPSGDVAIDYDDPPILGMSTSSVFHLNYLMDADAGGEVYDRQDYAVSAIGQAETPVNIRDVVEGYIVIHEKMSECKTIVDTIRARASAQPIQPIDEEARFEYILAIDGLINTAEKSMWSYNAMQNILNLYRKTLLLRDLLTLEPEGGFLNYIANYPDTLPDYSAELAYIKRTFGSMMKLFEDIEFYHHQMYWRVSVVTESSPDRSFILRPSQIAFMGSDDYTISTIASQCDAETGNILYHQLPYTILNVETA